MAACREAERRAAIQVIEDMTSGCSDCTFGYHELFDVAFEEIRHTLLEIWRRASPRECRVIGSDCKPGTKGCHHGGS